MKRLKSNLYWCLTSAKRKTKAEQSKRYCINKAKSYVKEQHEYTTILSCFFLHVFIHFSNFEPKHFMNIILIKKGVFENIVGQ